MGGISVVCVALLVASGASPALAKGGTPPAPATAGCFGFVYHPYLDGIEVNSRDKAVLDYLASAPVNIKTIAIDIRWWEVEEVLGTYDFSRYDTFFDLANQRGIKIMPLVAISCPPPWLLGDATHQALYADAEQMNNEGVLITDATNEYTDPQIATAPFSLSHRGVRILAASFTNATVDHFKGNSAFGKYWILSNEPIFPVTDSRTTSDPTIFYDYSPATIQSFQHWLFARANPGVPYDGSSGAQTGLPALMIKWGFRPAPWDTWDQVPAPTNPWDHDPPRETSCSSYWEDWMEFRETEIANFVQWHASLIRGADTSTKDKVVLKINSWVSFKPLAAQAGFNYYTVFKAATKVDVFAVDFYPDITDTHSLVRENELLMHFAALRPLINAASKELWIGELGESSLSGTGGSDMTASAIRRMTELSLCQGAKMIFYYTLDPNDAGFSLYYDNPNTPGFDPSAKPALNEIVMMNTDARIIKMASVTKTFKPQVGVVVSLPDIYGTPYWWDATHSAWQWPYKEALSRHALCQALAMANISYVILNENYLRENAVPSYVKVVYLPAVQRIARATANNLLAFVNGGGALWGDMQAGLYCLDDQSYKSSDTTYPMCVAFGTSYGPIARDPNDFYDHSMQITSSTYTEDLPVGTILMGTHAEPLGTPIGTCVPIARFADTGNPVAIWYCPSIGGGTERVASNLSARQFQRIGDNEDRGAALDVTTFRKFIVDFALNAKKMYLTSPQAGSNLKITVSTWDTTMIAPPGRSYTTVLEYFGEYSTGGQVTINVQHLSASTSYKVSYTPTGGTTVTLSSKAGSDQTLTYSFAMTAGVQYYVTVKKA